METIIEITEATTIEIKTEKKIEITTETTFEITTETTIEITAEITDTTTLKTMKSIIETLNMISEITQEKMETLLKIICRNII